MSRILTLNAGSSSIKFSLYALGSSPELVARGQVENLKSNMALLFISSNAGNSRAVLGSVDHSGALQAIIAAVAPMLKGEALAAVGHRVVHGGTHFTTPVLLNDEVMAELALLEPLAPLHQPHSLAAIRSTKEAFPGALQVGCFDTAFHRSHDWVHDTYALPPRYYDQGVRRYGFHGLSYDFIAGALAELDPDAGGRAVVCHLGNGASVCAIQDGRSVASSMGFSALDGVPMGTRCGQIDPGVLLYMMTEEGLGADEISELLFRQSGLKALSGISNDMRELEAAGTPEADRAIAHFTAHVRSQIASLAAALDGIDTLVFTGGIGEHSQRIRAEVCGRMGWLGVELNDAANAEDAPVISTGRVCVRVVPTDEEVVIARAAIAVLNGGVAEAV